MGKFHRSNETLALPEEESFYGLGERFTKLNKVGLRVNGWLVNAWGAGTDDTHKAIPFADEHRRLRHFCEHDVSQSLGHGQPVRGVVYVSGRRSAAGFLHYLWAEHERDSGSLRGDYRLAGVSAEEILWGVVCYRQPQQDGRNERSGNCEKIPGARYPVGFIQSAAGRRGLASGGGACADPGNG